MRDTWWVIDPANANAVMSNASAIAQAVGARKHNKKVEIPDSITPLALTTKRNLIDWHAKKFLEPEHDTWYELEDLRPDRTRRLVTPEQLAQWRCS